MGKRYAQIINGACPKHAEDPRGKVLNVTWAVTPPFVLARRPGHGSDFLVVKLFAKKFGFTPKFLREEIFDIEKSNGTSYGMIHRVKDTFFVIVFCVKFFSYHYLDFHKTVRDGHWATTY